MPKNSYSKDVIFEIAGHFRCNEVSAGNYLCTCEAPFNKRCLAIVINENGTTVIFDYEDPSNTSKFKKDDVQIIQSYYQTSSGQIGFQTIED